MTPEQQNSVIGSQAHTEQWQQELLALGVTAAVVETLTLVRMGNAATVASIESIKSQNAEQTALINRILSAFPDDGLTEHAAYHTAQRERAKFWRDMRTDLAKKGIVFVAGSLALFAVTALWVAFKAKIME